MQTLRETLGFLTGRAGDDVSRTVHYRGTDGTDRVTNIGAVH